MARIYTVFHSLLLTTKPHSFRVGNFLVSNLPLLAILLVVHGRISQYLID